MQFNSLSFLFIFLPVFLAVYYLFPIRWRSGILSLGSFLFYFLACGKKFWPLILLAGLILLTYSAGRMLERHRSRSLLITVLALMGGSLCFFKCFHGGRWLAAGYSFYLFQMSAYLLDVYWERMKAELNFLNFAAQISMFPKLLSGPIVKPAELAEQNRTTAVSGEEFHRGLSELIIGLSMKVLLANRLSSLWVQANIMGLQNLSAPMAWLALAGFAIRLYFDFYGYSLMAVGLGRMLGYTLPENFLDPYASCSVSEFYRRWHVSLGMWFREYVYIPLGGNRKGMFRTILNLIIVWAFTGFWHGVGGNYLVWAGILCFLIILEQLFLRRFLEKHRWLGHIYTPFVILLSWVPFAVTGWQRMGIYFGKLFGGFGPGINPSDWLIFGKQYGIYLLAGAVLMIPAVNKAVRNLHKHVWGDIILFLLFWLCVMMIATSAQDPFMYFQY